MATTTIIPAKTIDNLRLIPFKLRPPPPHSALRLLDRTSPSNDNSNGSQLGSPLVNSATPIDEGKKIKGAIGTFDVYETNQRTDFI